MQRQAARQTTRHNRHGGILATALLVALSAMPAAAQTTRFSAQPLVFPQNGNSGQNATLDITLTQATAIRSIIMPHGLTSISEFALTGQTGCVIDGTTVNPANTVCHVSIFFLPSQAGTRSGSVIITDAGGASTAFGVSGVGLYPVVAIYPSAAKIVTGLGPASPSFIGDEITSLLAGINAPTGMASDSFGNVYFADTNNDVVRMLDIFGNITFVAGGGDVVGAAADGGKAINAKLSHPTFLAVDSAGNLYIADTGNSVIRKVAMSASQTITTVAGNYTAGFTDDVAATSAQLNAPTGLAFDQNGNLYIADNGNHRIRTIDPTTGHLITLAGSGGIGHSSSGTSFSGFSFSAQIGGLAVSNGLLLVADSGNHQIYALPQTGTFNTGSVGLYAGTGSSGSSGDGGNVQDARFISPTGLAVDATGSLYISDSGAGVVRRVHPLDATIETVAGDTSKAGGFSSGVTPANTLAMNGPSGIAFDPQYNLYIADSGNNVIRKLPRVPAELAFATQNTGTTSAPQTIEIQNIGTDILNIDSLSADATTTSNFVFPSSPPCTNPVRPGTRCAFTIAFAPKQSGFIGGEVDVNHGLESEPIRLLGGPRDPLVITPDTLPQATLDQPYSTTVTATGGEGPLSISYYTDLLPPGITASLSTNPTGSVTFSGTPTLAFAPLVTVFASDPLGESVAKMYRLNVVAPTLLLEDFEGITAHDSITNVPGLIYNDNEAIAVQDNLVNVPGLIYTDNEAIGVNDNIVNVPALILADDEPITVQDNIVTSPARQSQTIAAPSIGGHKYGDATFSVAATSSSHLPVTITVDGPGSLTGSTLDIIGAGIITLKYTQDGDSNYSPASPVTVTFSVSKATAVVTPQNASRPYGVPNSPLAYTINNLVHGDTGFNIGGVPTLSTTAVLNSPAGNYTIMDNIGTLPTTNYNYTLFNGTLTVQNHNAQSITFGALPDVPLHYVSITLTAHSTSGLPITYTVSGPATVSGSKLTMTGTGVVNVTATQAGNATFDAALPVRRTFTVKP